MQYPGIMPPMEGSTTTGVPEVLFVCVHDDRAAAREHERERREALGGGAPT